MYFPAMNQGRERTKDCCDQLAEWLLSSGEFFKFPCTAKSSLRVLKSLATKRSPFHIWLLFSSLPIPIPQVLLSYATQDNVTFAKQEKDQTLHFIMLKDFHATVGKKNQSKNGGGGRKLKKKEESSE